MKIDEVRESLIALRKPEMRPQFKALILTLLDEHEAIGQNPNVSAPDAGCSCETCEKHFAVERLMEEL
jgi:hypothetical protein